MAVCGTAIVNYIIVYKNILNNKKHLMKRQIKKITLISVSLFLVQVFSSCTKEVPPELKNTNKSNITDQQKMPDDSIHRKYLTEMGHGTGKENESGTESVGDKTADILMKEADEADSKYTESKSEKDREECIEKQMLAANFLMFEADLPPKDKYKPALVRYRRVLQLDPKNTEAAQNKKQIEEIYESMGKPIPN